MGRHKSGFALTDAEKQRRYRERVAQKAIESTDVGVQARGLIMQLRNRDERVVILTLPDRYTDTLEYLSRVRITNLRDADILDDESFHAVSSAVKAREGNVTETPKARGTRRKKSE